MNLKVRLDVNSYLINCKIKRVIERVRKVEKDVTSYDLVDIECTNWEDIRQIFFNGNIGIPEEFEEGEIVLWNIEEKKKEGTKYKDIRRYIYNFKLTKVEEKEILNNNYTNNNNDRLEVFGIIYEKLHKQILERFDFDIVENDLFGDYINNIIGDLVLKYVVFEDVKNEDKK